ncbi:MAG: hypothetical protein AB7U38_03015 [Hyphomicrobiales bacterium]
MTSAVPDGGTSAPDETAIRRLRRCGWLGLVGLVASLPLVFAMGRYELDGYGLVTSASWLLVAAITVLCFRAAAAERRGERGPFRSLALLSVAALILPGAPIAALAPMSLMMGVARLAQNLDPREALFAVWGLLGIAFFVAIIVILMTVRRLRRRRG